MTRDQLALDADVALRTLARIERAEGSATVDTLGNLARALGVHPAAFLQDEFMMSSAEFIQHLEALRLTPNEAADLLDVSELSVRRWSEGEAVPGPVAATVRAWRQLDQEFLPWKPDSVSVFAHDKDQVTRIREHGELLALLLETVRARGGPENPWAVDLARQRATFGPAEVIYDRLASGGFAPKAYRRLDRRPTEGDLTEIQDACYCIALAFSQARAANEALVAIADHVKRNAGNFVTDGGALPGPEEVARKTEMMALVADELNLLASSALEGKAAYSQFEASLRQLHRIGFFPDAALVSAVARSMVTPPSVRPFGATDNSRT